MKTWQRIWLYGVILFFTFHLIRDLLQDLNIHSLISDIFVKQSQSTTPTWYWKIFNTYIISALEIILAIYSLKMKKFSLTGSLTVIIAIVFLVVWLIYWFLF